MYKVGDRVMVVTKEMLENDIIFKKHEGCYCPYVHIETGVGFNEKMLELCGTYVTIKDSDRRGCGRKYQIEEDYFWWIDDFFIKESLAPTKLQEYRYTRKNIVDNLGMEIERITGLVDESEKIQLEMLKQIKHLDDLIEEIISDMCIQ